MRDWEIVKYCYVFTLKFNDIRFNSESRDNRLAIAVLSHFNL